MDDDIADYFEQASIEGLFHPYIRFVPYSFPSLIENICDPSHFTVSHHGVFPLSVDTMQNHLMQNSLTE